MHHNTLELKEGHDLHLHSCKKPPSVQKSFASDKPWPTNPPAKKGQVHGWSQSRLWPS